MRTMFLTFDTFLAGIWGLTIVELISLMNFGDFSFIDNSIKTLLAAAGLFYLVGVKIPNEIRNSILKRRIDRAEAIRKERENETNKEHL